MTELSDTNYSGNRETRTAIENAKGMDLGPQADKHTGIAQAYASLNIAESLQMFQMVLENQTNKVIDSNDKLGKSNDRHSNRMFWLTLALVFAGVAQVVATAIAAIF